MTMMGKIVVLYHANCPDGFSAAWAAWKKFKNRAEYCPIDAGAPPPRGLRDKVVYVLDKNFRAAEIRTFTRANRQVTIIDHHVSGEHDVRQFPGNVFDLNHSGSVLAWRYFHPRKRVPVLLQHVEDIDLWRFRLPRTNEISAVVGLAPYEFTAWSHLARAAENATQRRKLVERGKLLLVYEARLIERQVKNAYTVRFAGYRALVVNTPLLHSKTAHELLQRRGPISIVWYEQGGERRYSLRSSGAVDVSKIAKRFGGGGHRAAAGFTLPVARGFPWRSTVR